MLIVISQEFIKYTNYWQVKYAKGAKGAKGNTDYD
jgi:hypothetical protein